MQIHTESFNEAVDQVSEDLQLGPEDMEAVVAVAAELLDRSVDMSTIDDAQISELVDTYLGAGPRKDVCVTDGVRTLVDWYFTNETLRLKAEPFECMTAMFFRDREKRMVLRLELGDQQVTLRVEEVPDVRALCYELQQVMRDAVANGETQKRYT